MTASSRNTPRPGEVYLEFIRVGNALRLAAVDAATGVEVTVMGPVNGSREELKRVALQKLKNRISQQT